MAAASDEVRTVSRHLGAKRKIPMGVDIIYAGTMVMIDSNGFALPAQASASNKGVHGVATETVDNSAGSAGDKSVEIQEGEFKFAGDTLEQNDVGSVVYADDDQTIDETQATNCPRAGILTEYISASEGWVMIGAALAS